MTSYARRIARPRWEPAADAWLQHHAPQARSLPSLTRQFNAVAQRQGWHARTIGSIKNRRYKLGSPGFRRRGARVRCVETNTVYPNAIDAAKTHWVTPVAIRIAIYRGRSCLGYHWEYLEDAA